MAPSHCELSHQDMVHAACEGTLCVLLVARSTTTVAPSCRLEYRGPNFQNPSIMDVLRRLPYLASAPEALLLWLRAYGELRSYQPAQCIIPRRVRMDSVRQEEQAGLMVCSLV